MKLTYIAVIVLFVAIACADAHNHKKGSAENQSSQVDDLPKQVCQDSASSEICSHALSKGLCEVKPSSSLYRKILLSCQLTCGLCNVSPDQCPQGYTHNEDSKQCVDIDECALGTTICVANTVCINTLGNYRCDCKEGYRGDGRVLCNVHVADRSPACGRYQGYSWCPELSKASFMQENCPVTCGFGTLTCAPGYTPNQDGLQCDDVDECSSLTERCGPHSTCRNVPGSYRCYCNVGYRYNRETKQCIENCKDKSEKCGDNINCYNPLTQSLIAKGCPASCGFCDNPKCDTGYMLSSEGQCIDINECANSELYSCGENAKCVNIPGGYQCVCIANYVGNPDIKCTASLCSNLFSAVKCYQLAKVKNSCTSASGFMVRYCPETCGQCQQSDDVGNCRNGYKPHDGTCVDINECLVGSHQCPTNSQCINTWGGYKCRCQSGFSSYKDNSGKWSCISEKYCFASGDPHFRTFDDAMIHFQGVCTYTLAQPIQANLAPTQTFFNVEIKNEHRDSPLVSWAKYVTLDVYGVTVKLGANRTLYVNDEVKVTPYEPTPQIKVTLSGIHILVVVDFGLKVSYDGNHYVKVAVPESYSGLMAGICGNMDGKPENDYVTKDGTPNAPTNADIGNSWVVPGKDPEGCVIAPNEGTSCDPRLQPSIQASCGVLADPNGPFAVAHSVLDPSRAVEGCVIDMCIDSPHPESLCRNLQAYADEAEEQGIVIKWRSATLCPLTCGPNMQYQSCMSACPASCSDPVSEADCAESCVEGCACLDGFILSGNTCVKKEDCGCQYDGEYHSVGEFWVDDECHYTYMCKAPMTIEGVEMACRAPNRCDVYGSSRACVCASGDATCEQLTGTPRDVPCDSDYNPDTRPTPVQPVSPYTPPKSYVPPGATYNKPNEAAEDRDDQYFAIKPEAVPAPKAKPLGIDSGVIPDTAILSSTFVPGHEPQMARPKSLTGWKPDPKDTNPWIAVDMGSPTPLHGLGTLGHSTDNCFVKQYTVSTSLDGITYTPLMDLDTNQPRVFGGNSDQNTWKRHCLHQYYGNPPTTRYVRFSPHPQYTCIGMRLELYGFRDSSDPLLIKILRYDVWTLATSGCTCYFDKSRTDCACCQEGGCQCPGSNPHQCVQCGYGSNCGIPEAHPPQEQLDQWTISETGCTCPFDSSRTDCACCVNDRELGRIGCQCGEMNPNQCVQCGLTQFACGRKESIFGPNKYCTPKVCPAGSSLPAQ